MILLIIMITQLHYKKAFENFLKRHSASWEAKMLVVQWRHHARIHFGYHTDIYRAHFHHTRNEKRPDIMAPDTSAFASSDIGIKNSITEENWRFNQSWFASLSLPCLNSQQATSNKAKHYNNQGWEKQQPLANYI